MRELFKAKTLDNREWRKGNLITSKPRYLIVPEFGVKTIADFKNRVGDRLVQLYAFEVDENTICQYTDLTDKNDNKIWENDITKLVLPDGEIRYFKVSIKKVIRKIVNHPAFDCYTSKVEITGVVFEWNGYDLFPCVDTYGKGIPDYKEMEVVGNIFDNPELLEVSNETPKRPTSFVPVNKPPRKKGYVDRTDNWIPVSKRLPSFEERRKAYCRDMYGSEFIVMIEGATQPTTLYIKMEEDIWFDDHHNYYSVVAWQPLPEAAVL